ncbi:hypothetical protein SESBI_03082 [Sesbania bispinosa]|nr:hypothetical protein SESBI_03082 [Sesbania bispinosa]
MVRTKITTVAGPSGSRGRKRVCKEPSLDIGRFKYAYAVEHYNYIQNYNFIVERPVELHDGEFNEFNLEITRRE